MPCTCHTLKFESLGARGDMHLLHTEMYMHLLYTDAGEHLARSFLAGAQLITVVAPCGFGVSRIEPLSSPACCKRRLMEASMELPTGGYISGESLRPKNHLG